MAFHEPATSADEGLVIVSRVAAKFSDVAQLKSALLEGQIKGKRLVLRER